MASSRDLYPQKSANLANGKAISSNNSLAFSSQLSSLISSAPESRSKPTSTRLKPKKDDLFTRPNRNTAKRAKDDAADSPHFEQKHTTKGGALDRGLWERSQRKMEEKARLYAAMKRGDVEDADEKYGVDFDRKWAESREKGDAEDEEVDDDDEDAEGDDGDMVEYTDEFGRSRRGTRAEVARAHRMQKSRADLSSDRFTSRPSAPSNIIYGDTIQHEAFDPDAPIAAQMEKLARKRDKSLTPPPEEHFDGAKEVRNKGTGFFQFSSDAEERKKQMDNLESERRQTEQKRDERQRKVDERKKQIDERRMEIQQRRGKRKAEDFLNELGKELGGKMSSAVESKDSDDRDAGPTKAVGR
jgi:hypothetical protein